MFHRLEVWSYVVVALKIMRQSRCVGLPVLVLG